MRKSVVPVVPDESVQYFLRDLEEAVRAYEKDGPFFPNGEPDPKLARHTQIFNVLRERASLLGLNFPAEVAKLKGEAVSA